MNAVLYRGHKTVFDKQSVIFEYNRVFLEYDHNNYYHIIQCTTDVGDSTLL